MQTRKLFFYKNYFHHFFENQNPRVKKKIIWTLRVVEELERIPEIYFKHLEGTEGIFEIRIQSGSDAFRVFCFFEKNNLIIIGHGFQKKTQKTPYEEIERAKKLKRSTMKTNKNLTSLEHLLDKEYGKRGTKKREKFEEEYEAFKLGVLIQQAREKKGMTQEQVANLSGTNKSYISKLEKDLKDVRFSTLLRIVKEGLGGKLIVSIKF